MKTKKIFITIFIMMIAFLFVGCGKAEKKLPKITYELDGGVWTETNFKNVVEKEMNDFIDEPKNPTKEGHKFLGWYLIKKNDKGEDVEAGKIDFSNYRVSEFTITLKAKWQKWFLIKSFFIFRRYMKNIFRDLLTDKKNAKAIITGLSYDKGASCGKGAALAPYKVFELSGFLPPLTKDGYLIKNKIFNNGIYKIKNLDEISKISSGIYNSQKLNIFIGGDHSVSINTEKEFIKYCKDKSLNPVIIHIDAHPDFCNSYNGSIYSHACTNYRSMENGCNKFFLIGIRGWEYEETVLFTEKDFIKVYKASDCKKIATSNLADEIVKKISKDDAVYISFDIDAIDPGFAPGTGTPEAFGLNPDYVLDLLNIFFNKLNVLAIDFV